MIPCVPGRQHRKKAMRAECLYCHRPMVGKGAMWVVEE